MNIENVVVTASVTMHSGASMDNYFHPIVCQYELTSTPKGNSSNAYYTQESNIRF